MDLESAIRACLEAKGEDPDTAYYEAQFTSEDDFLDGISEKPRHSREWDY